MGALVFPIISENDSKLPFYIKSVGIQDEQEQIRRPGGHPEFHYLHTCSGEGKLVIDGKEFTLKPGSGFFFKPEIPHEYYSAGGVWKTYWITFEGYAVNELCKNIFHGDWTVFTLGNQPSIESQLDKICETAALKDFYSNHNSSVLLYEFLILLKANINENAYQIKPLTKNQLQTVLQYIENHYSNCLTLDELSSVINVTPQHLCRLFKQTYNMRPFEYVTRYRLKCAKELLLNPDDYPIKAIAVMVGYNDTSYFCSTFREYEGCSPLEFKKIRSL